MRFRRKKLSHRQKEIMDLVAEGLSDKQINDRLHITQGTMNYHRSKIFNKLGAFSRAHALSIYRGLIQPQ